MKHLEHFRSVIRFACENVLSCTAFRKWKQTTVLKKYKYILLLWFWHGYGTVSARTFFFFSPINGRRDLLNLAWVRKKWLFYFSYSLLNVIFYRLGNVLSAHSSQTETKFSLFHLKVNWPNHLYQLKLSRKAKKNCNQPQDHWEAFTDNRAEMWVIRVKERRYSTDPYCWIPLLIPVSAVMTLVKSCSS